MLLENTRYANGYQCLLTGWIYQYLFTGYTNVLSDHLLATFALTAH